MSELIQVETSRIARVWERFVAGDEVDLSCLRPEIAESWRRCRDEFHVPLDTTRVPSRAEEISTLDADLKEASIQVIDLLQAAIRRD